MSLEPDAEVPDSDWERPVVLPVFQIPTRMASGVAWALVVSAALAIVAAFVTAAAYQQPVPPRGFSRQEFALVSRQSASQIEWPCLPTVRAA